MSRPAKQRRFERKLRERTTKAYHVEKDLRERKPNADRGLSGPPASFAHCPNCGLRVIGIYQHRARPGSGSWVCESPWQAAQRRRAEATQRAAEVARIGTLRKAS